MDINHCSVRRWHVKLHLLSFTYEILDPVKLRVYVYDELRVQTHSLPALSGLGEIGDTIE
jgi:hypothetical protein